MTDSMKKFMDVVSENAELATRVSNMDKEAIIAEAQKRGIALAEADFTGEKNVELSEDELNEVAGGGKCACVAGGGGSKGDNLDMCACAFLGYGDFKGGTKRCSCMGAGGGVDH